MDSVDFIDYMAFQPRDSQGPENLSVATQQSSDLPDAIKEESNELALATAPILEPSDRSPPLSEYDSLRAHLAQNRHDPPAWNRLIDLAEESGDLATVKDAYESLLQAYPNTVRFFLFLLRHYLHPGLFPNAEALFSRFLRPSPSVPFWKFYLTYVRRMNKDPSTRQTIIKSYDFALLYIGQDKDSGAIWREYIDFVKAGETHTTRDEQHKMDALRRLYQRAVQIPLDILEQLWSEYNAFEIALNKITARKFIQDQSKGYMTAKEVLKQLRSHLTILFPPPASIPHSGRKPFDLPVPTSPYSEGHRIIAKSWRSYLHWEEKNPLDIEDKSVLSTRILCAYKKAVVHMRFNPETWYMAYNYVEKNLKAEEAFLFLKSGLEVNPASFVLNFAYAEAQENARNYAEVHTIFTNFIEILHVELEKQAEVASIGNLNGSVIIQQSSSSSWSTLTTEKEFAKRRTELCIAWITYMRFARRAEGLKQARTVFGKARKDKWIGWEVYDAAASLEYHFTKAVDVATRIYETGLNKFKEEAEYALRYLKFLIQINDNNNAKALFERVITTFTPEKARPLWKTMANYEYNHGDLNTAVELDKRMSEVYPEDNSMRRFAQRHMYGNHDPIAERDLGWVRSTPGSSKSGHGSIRQDLSSSMSSGVTSSNVLAWSSTPSKKRPPPESPEYGRTSGSRRAEGPDSGPPSKKPREHSPLPPPRDRGRELRERDGRDGRPQPQQRYDSPDWARSSPPRRRDDEITRRDWEKGSDSGDVPNFIVFFMGQLPQSVGFDGPVFRVEDLMQVFRNSRIPSMDSGRSPLRVRSPGGGRAGQ
ncbi:Suf-domain-containing protein [Hysterangium stoloniferum]|nr:Suf-domain-containing protein [Hysterangium stoloniferum]